MARCAKIGCTAQTEAPTDALCTEHRAGFVLSRADGERIRFRHQMTRLVGILNGIGLSVEDVNNPPGFGPGEALQTITTEIVTTLARLDAYMRSEGDRSE